MFHGAQRAATLSRVHPLVPAVVVLVGIIVVFAGHSMIGAGIAVGAVLAYVNGLLLSGRVDIAAASGDMARALLIMQSGLMVTFVVVGVATVILVKISVPLAVSAAISFGVTQMAILATFYWTRARRTPVSEGKAST
jgi:hypothetical protein